MHRKAILHITALMLFSVLPFHHPMYGQSDYQEECTIGVALGSATDDGRPLLWKTRDNTVTDNHVKYNISYKYKFISVSNADSSTLPWMGVNEHGLSIVNSTAYDLPAYPFGPGNGMLMREVLGNCKTVAEFQHYLDSTNHTGRTTQSNFAVIDSTGAAVLFETGGRTYCKYDASDSENGYIIRTNFSMCGGGSGGLMRYNRSTELIGDFFSGDTLNLKSIFRYQMRDFSDDNGEPIAVPYPYSPEIGIPFGYLNCKKSICHTASVSAAVIHGVLPSELAGLTTMWVILGHPASSVALPYWPVGPAPIEAGSVSRAELCDEAKEIRAILFDYPDNKNYIDSYKLRDANGEGLWSCLFPLEDLLFSETTDYMDSLRRLAYLPVQSMLMKEAYNSAFALSELQNCKDKLVLNESIGFIIAYPNPACDKLYIDYSLRKDFNIELFTILGECVLQTGLSNGVNEIDIASLKQGIYIIQVTAENKSYRQKLMKM